MLAYRTHVCIRVCVLIIASIFTPHRVCMCVCLSDPMKRYNYYTGLFCISVCIYDRQMYVCMSVSVHFRKIVIINCLQK